MLKRATFNELYTSAAAVIADDCETVSSGAALIREILREDLTKKQKCYIMLYYTQNKTVTEIAAMFGVNKSTVSRTVNRGKKRILKAIGRELALRSRTDSAALARLSQSGLLGEDNDTDK